MPPNGATEDLHFDSIPDAIHAFRNGQFIIVLDSTSRENEGDLIIAAEDITTEQMAFMVRHTRFAFASSIPLSPPSAFPNPSTYSKNHPSIHKN